MSVFENGTSKPGLDVLGLDVLFYKKAQPEG